LGKRPDRPLAGSHRKSQFVNRKYPVPSGFDKSPLTGKFIP